MLIFNGKNSFEYVKYSLVFTNSILNFVCGNISFKVLNNYYWNVFPKSNISIYFYDLITGLD